MNKEELVETRILEKMEVRRLTCCCLVSNSNNIQVTVLFTGLPVRPSHKMGFRSSAAKNGLPGEGRHEGLVPRSDVLSNGFT